jgi:hypothetical protein
MIGYYNKLLYSLFLDAFDAIILFDFIMLDDILMSVGAITLPPVVGGFVDAIRVTVVGFVVVIMLPFLELAFCCIIVIVIVIIIIPELDISMLFIAAIVFSLIGLDSFFALDIPFFCFIIPFIKGGRSTSSSD